MWPRLTAFRRRHVPCDFSRRRSAVLPGTVCGLRQFFFSREPFSVSRTGWWGCNAVGCCSGVPFPVTAILRQVHRGLYHWLQVHAGAALWSRLLLLSKPCPSLSTPSLHACFYTRVDLCMRRNTAWREGITFHTFHSPFSRSRLFCVVILAVWFLCRILAVYSRWCRSAFWLTVPRRTYVSTYVHQYFLQTHTQTHAHAAQTNTIDWTNCKEKMPISRNGDAGTQ